MSRAPSCGLVAVWVRPVPEVVGEADDLVLVEVGADLGFNDLHRRRHAGHPRRGPQQQAALP